MKLPKWIPKIPRPWNPAYREVWDSMTSDEKRASWLVDAMIILGAILTVVVCRYVP